MKHIVVAKFKRKTDKEINKALDLVMLTMTERKKELLDVKHTENDGTDTFTMIFYEEISTDEIKNRLNR